MTRRRALIAATQSIAEKAITLQQSTGSVRTLARATQDRLQELRLQVDSFRRTCNLRDRPLCDTIDSAGLEIKIDLDKVNEIDTNA
jgi:hypothetical protein